MKHKRKIWTALVTAFCILAGAIALMGMTPLSASADVFPPDLTAEQFTDSDKLLNSDGTESDKSIQDFVKELKGDGGAYKAPDLYGIIPKEYLNTLEEKAVFQYYGKEYGFYLEKNGKLFSLLLIDFKYEFSDPEEDENGTKQNTASHPDHEFVIRVDPILQCNFNRYTDIMGNYVFQRTLDSQGYTYYVSNPRFVVMLQNENAMNYGDFGYSKHTDDGLIIFQTRLNYGTVVYKTEQDLWGQLQKLAVNTLLDVELAIIDSSTGGVIGFVKDMVERGTDIFKQGQEKVIEFNNENNVFSQQSKTYQKEHDEIPGYSRTMGIVAQEEIVLSDDSKSYAECIVALDGINYRSRLTQICEFDIVRRHGNYSSMEFVAGNSVNLYASALSFQKERFLFEDREPQGEVSQEDFAGNQIPVYVLPGGEHIFRFKPQYSGKYIFEMPENADLYIDGNKADQIRSKCEVYLNENTEYRLTVRGKLNIEKINSYMTCRIPEFNGQTVSVKGSSNHILQYKPTDRGYQKLTVDQTNCKIRILDEDYQIIQSSNSNTVFANFNPDRKYYIVISNPSSFAAECTVQIQAPNSVALGDIFYLSPDNQTVSFTNTSLSDNYYKMSVPIANVAVQNVYGNNIANCMIDGANYIYEFALAAGKKCFISFPVSDPNISVEIKVLI